MSLRDQPILDRFQSEIFRLPLGSQLIILGPPGTGKTTTLIKRLGQKLNIEYLEADEQSKIKNTISGEAGHKTSWLMFTPTDLLKHYLKEAFAKEQVPASSEQIKTWWNYSNDLGRNVLSILQTSGGSGFVIKTVQHLKDGVELPDFYEAFYKYHKLAIRNELQASVKQLAAFENEKIANINHGLESIKKYLDQDKLMAFYRGLEQYQEEIQRNIKELKVESDTQLKRALNFQLNNDRSFITDLIEVINEWKTSKAALDDEDDEEEDETIVTPNQKAFSDYKKVWCDN